MKKIALTLMVILIVISPLFGEPGTVKLIFSNGNVSYTETKTFYEFDILGYIDGGSTVNVFYTGQFYIKYDTNIFGEFIYTNNKVSYTLLGPLAYEVSSFSFYSIVNIEDTQSDILSIVFEADQNKQKYDDENNYISTLSSAPSELIRVKIEVSASGNSTIYFPTIDQINNLFFEYISDGPLVTDSYEGGLSNADATETTDIIYSGSGDPALPITLEDFIAEYKNGAVTLQWTTASETQNIGFVLKRAVKEGDAPAYDIIASYQNNDALLGAGTTTDKHTYHFSDAKVKPGETYSYILEDVDYSGNVTSHSPITVSIPENVLFANSDFQLEPAYPNPFNPVFTLPFELNRAMDVRINLYDINGKQVRTIANRHMQAGRYDMRVDASHLNSGIYFVRAVIGDQVLTQKVLLVK